MHFFEDRASIVIIVFDVDFTPGFDFAFDFASTSIIILGLTRKPGGPQISMSTPSPNGAGCTMELQGESEHLL